MVSLLLMPMLFFCTSNLDPTEGASTVNVTYSELQELNVTCPPHDTCTEPRNADELMTQNCNCDTICAQLGTCCVDAFHRYIPMPKVRPSCRSLEGNDTGFFIMDQCPQSGYSKSAYEELCREEWNGQNDVMRLVPVTSLFTHITYKNYFCFRCNEATHDYLFWNIGVTFPEEHEIAGKNSNSLLSELSYNTSSSTWVAPIDQGCDAVPVSLNFATPSEIASVPKLCWLNTISNCSGDWKDDEIRLKCDAYMSLTDIARDGYTLKYRNPHCAVCNFESLENVVCRDRGIGLSVLGRSPAKQPFSFAVLLDINRSDGEQVGKVELCSGNNVWDPFFKKCRSLSCALPGHVVKDEKCAPA